MILIVIEALVSSLTKHLCDSYLKDQEKIEIGGAPYWYMKPLDDQTCAFAHKSGGMDSIDIAKNDAKLKLIKKIDGTIDIVVYNSTSKITDKKEKEVVEKFRKDKNLEYFINSNLHYSKIVYEDEVDTTFARVCIPNDKLISYQKDRLLKIKNAVFKVKANNAFDELDASVKENPNTKDSNDPFSELPDF